MLGKSGKTPGYIIVFLIFTLRESCFVVQTDLKLDFFPMGYVIRDVWHDAWLLMSITPTLILFFSYNIARKSNMNLKKETQFQKLKVFLLILKT